MLKLFLDNLLITAPCSIGLLYLITATILYLRIKLNRDENGYPIINPDSWHFKVAYPFKKYDTGFIEKLEEKPFSICPYGIKFFLMLYFGFPILIIWTTALLIVLNTVMIPFGGYVKPDFEQASADELPFTVSRHEYHGSLPKLNNKLPLLPIFLLIPSAYVLWFWLKPAESWKATWITLTITLGGAIFIGIIVVIAKLCGWFKNTDQNQVSLARETISSTYKRFCILVKVQRIKVDQE